VPYDPSNEQKAVITAEDSVVVVLGGAGSGKTTTAAAAAARRLTDLDEQRAALQRATPFGTVPNLPPAKRVLFISFSRTAVSQIVDRAASVLGAHRSRIDVVTFHGLAWRILNDFGRHYGIPHPLRVRSAAETRLGLDLPGMTYDQLMAAAQRILAVPTVDAFYQDRYVTVICDEFQDTDDAEWTFMQSVAPTAQRILLGDLNQCIYAGMKNIDPAARIAHALALPGAEKIELPARSYRDPTGVLPAAAQAALERRFHDPAIAAAVLGQRLVIHRAAAIDVTRTALDVISTERQHGKTVSVFTHTYAAAAELSGKLAAAEIDHEQVGFTEAFWRRSRGPASAVALGPDPPTGCAHGIGRLPALGLTRQERNCAGERHPCQDKRGVRGGGRGRHSRPRHPHHTKPEPRQTSRGHRSAHQRLGFPRGEETWNVANQYLRRAARALEANGSAETLALEVERVRVDTLVGFMNGRTKPVQVMNLHQTKGREADATVLLLQEDEYHGKEGEPYPTASRLLYVCMTRARGLAHIVVPDLVHPLWLPLVNRCIQIGDAAQPDGLASC